MLSSRNIICLLRVSSEMIFSARSPLFLILRNMQTQIIPITIWSLNMLSTCKFDMNSFLLHCSSLTSFVVNYSLNRICMFFNLFWKILYNFLRGSGSYLKRNSRHKVKGIQFPWMKYTWVYCSHILSTKCPRLFFFGSFTHYHYQTYLKWWKILSLIETS